MSEKSMEKEKDYLKKLNFIKEIQKKINQGIEYKETIEVGGETFTFRKLSINELLKIESNKVEDSPTNFIVKNIVAELNLANVENSLGIKDFGKIVSVDFLLEIWKRYQEKLVKPFLLYEKEILSDE